MFKQLFTAITLTALHVDFMTFNAEHVGKPLTGDMTERATFVLFLTTKAERDFNAPLDAMLPLFGVAFATIRDDRMKYAA